MYGAMHQGWKYLRRTENMESTNIFQQVHYPFANSPVLMRVSSKTNAVVKSFYATVCSEYQQGWQSNDTLSLYAKPVALFRLFCAFLDGPNFFLILNNSFTIFTNIAYCQMYTCLGIKQNNIKQTYNWKHIIPKILILKILLDWNLSIHATKYITYESETSIWIIFAFQFMNLNNYMNIKYI